MKNDCICESNEFEWGWHRMAIPGAVPEAEVRPLAMEIIPAILKRLPGGWKLPSRAAGNDHLAYYFHHFNEDKDEWRCEIKVYSLAEKKGGRLKCTQ